MSIGAQRKTDEMHRVLRYIEDNLKESMDIGSVAEAIGYSPSHFCRLFSIYVGTSVMSYVRRRRLLAALKMIKKGEKVIDCAMEYGFDTHTGFLKAFKKEFGCTPQEYHRNEEKILNEKEINVMNLIPEIMKRDNFKLAGYVLSTDTGYEHTNLKPTFYYKNEEILVVDGTRVETLLDTVVKPKKHGEYAFFYPITVNGKEECTYVMCADCEDFSDLPEKLIKIEMPAATYAVFTTPPADDINGECEKAINATWKYIFEEWLPNSEYKYDESKTDFEYYDLRCHVQTNSVIEIHVPVVKK